MLYLVHLISAPAMRSVMSYIKEQRHTFFLTPDILRYRPEDNF